MSACPTFTRALAPLLLASALAGCGGGGTDGSNPPASTDMAQRSQAARETAQNNAACTKIRPFYWEIGDRSARQASGSLAGTGGLVNYTASSVMPIASASKWLYGAYVAERRGSAGLTAEDVQYLHFQSGYTNFTVQGCDPGDTVASCVARASHGVQDAATVGKFYYNGGHMQKHASLPAPGMELGSLDNASLATEVRRVLGNDIALSYTQPQLAGGARTSAADYAVFLRKLLGSQLRMSALLGSQPVCTNPATCTTAVYTPTPRDVSWHYAVGHWVEDDPVSGDGAYSSPGAFGFYPWLDASKTWYGIVARVDAGSGAYVESAACGALIRKAWLTGSAQ